MQASNYPPLPSASTDTLFTFYPYRLSSRSSLHASLYSQGPREPPSSSSASGLSTTSRPSASAGPSTRAPALTRNEQRQALRRAERRALRARRPAGVALGAEAMDLSDEEAQLDEEKHELNQFGHRFLIPIGRRITQMESEAAPSPTPSDHEQRQEDRNGVVSPASIADAEEEADDREGVIDLDGSIEDLDASRPEESGEYDSDDIRLMEAMDRSVGSVSGEVGSDMEEE